VVGLEVEQDGVRRNLAASRVVLSAGAVATPGILLRSGIGPRDEVRRLGITPIVDLPAVGARLWDHPGAALFFRPKRGFDTSQPIIQTVHRYTSAGGHVPNDMQVQPGSFAPLPWFILPFFVISICVGKPRTPGRIRFRSVDPDDKVDLDCEFFADPVDRARATDGLQLALDLAQQPAMRELGSLFYPAEKVVRSREKFADFLQRRCGSGFHPSGTVPMGPEGAPDAATDGRGRVRGVEGLIVADASLMPTVTSANTNLPTLMMGERFGAWLRDGEL
jgi:choline dehydrogenase